MLSLRMERTEGLNAASSFPAGLFGGALAAGSTVCLRFSSAALLLGAGLNRQARSALCRETPPHFNSTPEVVDDPEGAAGNAELAGNCVFCLTMVMVVISSYLYVPLNKRKHLPFCLSKLS